MSKISLLRIRDGSEQDRQTTVRGDHISTYIVTGERALSEKDVDEIGGAIEDYCHGDCEWDYDGVSQAITDTLQKLGFTTPDYTAEELTY